MDKVFKSLAAYDDSKQVIKYLNDNYKYPFKLKRMRVMIIDSITNELCDVMKDLFSFCDMFIYNNHLVIFYNEDIPELEQIINSIADDLGESFKVHNGIYISKNYPGNIVLNYIDMMIKFIDESIEFYTDLISPFTTKYLNIEYEEFFQTYIFDEIFKDALTKDIIVTYYKNDLNVLKTSKQLYLNRNSVLNKFDNINKTTGINLQKFSHAAVIYLILTKR